MMDVRKNRNRIWSKLLLLGLLLGPVFVGAEADGKSRSLFDILQYQEILEVTLEMDMQAVLGDRRNEEKHQAIFSFRDASAQYQEWLAKVKVRGKFRRLKCEAMPPLKLNFKKGHLAAAGLALFDDMKLVTHCVNDDEQAKNLLVREYLAYKIYNELTTQSYRVQFVKINYKDSDSENSFIQYGFLIEDIPVIPEKRDT